MERRIVILSILMVFLVSCSQGGFHVPIASSTSVPETTYAPELPTRTRIANREVLDGVMQVSNLVLKVDGPEAKVTLKGDVVIRPVSGSNKGIHVPLNVAGVIDPANYSSYMNATNPVQLEALGIKLGVKLMCLTDDCSDSFMDIYVNHQGHIYRHQVRSAPKKAKPEIPAPSVSPSASPSPSATPPSIDNNTDEVTTEDEPEHDGVDEEDSGTFVGEPEKDLEVFFPQEPKKPVDPLKDHVPKKPVTPPIKLDPPTTAEKEPSILKKYLDNISQSIGTPNAGSLQNPVNIYKFQQESQNPGFRIYNPKEERYYGTTDMLNMIARIGQFSISKVGYVLSINDISDKNGGRIAPHKSHQSGLDADIAYYFDDPEFRQKGNFINVIKSTRAMRSWMSEKQWELFKNLVSTNMVDRIFVDNKIKLEICQHARRNSELSSSDSVSAATLRLMKHERGHANHFHLRIKCSKAQPRCQQMAPAKYPLGC